MIPGLFVRLYSLGCCVCHSDEYVRCVVCEGGHHIRSSRYSRYYSWKRAMPLHLSVTRTPVSKTLAQGNPLTEVMRGLQVTISAVRHLSLRKSETRPECMASCTLPTLQRNSPLRKGKPSSYIPCKACQMLAPSSQKRNSELA